MEFLMINLGNTFSKKAQNLLHLVQLGTFATFSLYIPNIITLLSSVIREWNKLFISIRNSTRIIFLKSLYYNLSDHHLAAYLNVTFLKAFNV